MKPLDQRNPKQRDGGHPNGSKLPKKETQERKAGKAQSRRENNVTQSESE